MENKPVAVNEIAAGILPALHELVERESNIAKNGKQKYLMDDRFLDGEECLDNPGVMIACDRCKNPVFNYFWTVQSSTGTSKWDDICPNCLDAESAERSKEARFKLTCVHCTDTALKDLEKFLFSLIA